MQRNIRAILSMLVTNVVYLNGVMAATSVVGSVPGDFSVSPMGTATYTLPIEVPQGIAGVTPQLSLSYNSQGQNGITGIGWSLNATNEIARCPAEPAYENKRSGIEFNTQRFCWNGERLIRKATPNAAFTCDATASLVDEYKTVNDKFVRVFSCSTTDRNDPAYFMIYTKDGRVLTYGKRSDSQVVRVQNSVTYKFVWSVEKVADRAGNYFNFYYNAKPSTEHVLTAITYTGRTNPVVDPNRAIVFVYQQRPDPTRAFLTGSSSTDAVSLQMDFSRRLTEIRTYAKAVVTNPSTLITNTTTLTDSVATTGDMIRTYRLNYAPQPASTSALTDYRSRVDNIDQCGYDPGNVLVCVPKTTFTMTTHDRKGFAATTQTLTLSADGMDWSQLLDFDGDGVIDIVNIAKATGNITVTLRNRDGSTKATNTTVSAAVVADANNIEGFSKWNELADVNGDGIFDLVRVVWGDASWSSYKGGLDVLLGNSAGGFSSAQRLTVQSSTYGSTTASITYGPEGFHYYNQLVDMNADGIPDLVRVLRDSTTGAALNQFEIFTASVDSSVAGIGVKYVSTGTYNLAASGRDNWDSSDIWGFRRTNFFGDFNGDGIVDVMQVSSMATGSANILFGSISTSASGVIYSYKNTAVSGLTFPLVTNSSQNQYGIGVYGKFLTYQHQFVDINGDGILDVVRANLGSPVYSSGPAGGSSGSCSLHVGPNYAYCGSASLTTTSYVGVYVPQFDGSANIYLGDGKGSFSLKSTTSANSVGTKALNVEELYVTTSTSQILVSSSSPGGIQGCDAGASSCPSGTSYLGTVSDSHTHNLCQQVTTCTSYTAQISQSTFTYVQALNISGKGISATNRFTDVNQDGIVDIIRLDGGSSAATYVSFGNGDGSFRSPVTLGAVAGSAVAASLIQRESIQLLDLNSDGVLDFVLPAADTKSATVNFASDVRPGLLTNVVTGTNATVTVEYKPMSDTTVYSIDKTAVFPERMLGGTSPLVSAYVISGADTNTYRKTYAYKNLKMHFVNGLSGFGDIIFKDMRTTPALVNKFTLNQTFPYAGRPSHTEQGLDLSTGYRAFETRDYTWRDKAGTDGSHYVYQSQLIEHQYEPSASWAEVALTTTNAVDNGGADTYPFDEFGNPEKISVSHKDGTQTETVYSNTLQTNIAFPGVFSNQIVSLTTTGRDSTTQTRTIRYDFDPVTGQLATKTEEPNKAASEVLGKTTSYAYYPGGLLQSVTTTAWSGAYDDAGNPQGTTIVDRVTTFSYDMTTDARYNVVTRSESVASAAGGALNVVNKIDVGFDVVTRSVGADGVPTTYAYDAFGRRVLETRGDGTSTELQISAANSTTDTSTPANAKYVLASTLISSSNVRLPIGRAFFDAFGRELRSVKRGFNGVDVYDDTTYDSAGRTLRDYVSYAAGGTATLFTEYAYDELSRVNRVTAPNLAYRQFYRDGFVNDATLGGMIKSRVTFTADGVTRTNERYVGSDGALIKVKDENVADVNNVTVQNETLYGYWPSGQLKSVTAPNNGGNHAYDYNLFGHRTSASDPNVGAYLFRYNGFGDVVWQKDPKGQITRMTYDTVGRLTSRTEPAGNTTATSTWVYDEVAAGAAAGGKLTRVTGTNGYDERYYFDTAGRTSQSNITIDKLTYSTGVTFDAFGRLSTVSYPNGGMNLRNVYSTDGYLQQIQDRDDFTKTYWTATAYNVLDQITGETFGNGVTTTRNFNLDTGTLRTISSAKAGVSVQDLTYGYFQNGNLQSRQDNRQTLTETFTYDALERVSTVLRNGAQVDSLKYDINGNIQYRQTVGTYQYDPARPQAVVAIRPTALTSGLGGKGDVNVDSVVDNLDTVSTVNQVLGVATVRNTANADCVTDSAIDLRDVVCIRKLAQQTANMRQFTYDANGNMTSGAGRTLGYTSFDKPDTISANGHTVQFAYGPGHERIKKIDATASATITTTYIGKSYERIDSAGTTQHRYYLYVDGRAIAVATTNLFANTREVKYLHADNLGSTDTVTDASGNVLERDSFDAFGLRRTVDWQVSATDLGSITSRGYTGHEMDDELGLINMNARLYDPKIGRFLQADSIVADMTDLQSLNRYSYVNNNPLKFVDPTGHAYCSNSPPGPGERYAMGACVVGSPQGDYVRPMYYVETIPREYSSTGGGYGGGFDYSSDLGGGAADNNSSAGNFYPSSSYSRDPMDGPNWLGYLTSQGLINQHVSPPENHSGQHLEIRDGKFAWVNNGARYQYEQWLSLHVYYDKGPYNGNHMSPSQVAAMLGFNNVSVGTAVRVIGAVLVEMAPGKGVYDGIQSWRNGDYLTATWQISTEFPAFKPAKLLSMAMKEVKVASKAVTAEARAAATAYKDFNQARNEAVRWLGDRGFKAEQATIGKLGNKGMPIGMKSADGKSGFRVEYDERHGAHINVWSGKSKETFSFEGNQSMVDQIVKQFIKER